MTLRSAFVPLSRISCGCALLSSPALEAGIAGDISWTLVTLMGTWVLYWPIPGRVGSTTLAATAGANTP